VRLFSVSFVNNSVISKVFSAFGYFCYFFCFSSFGKVETFSVSQGSSSGVRLALEFGGCLGKAAKYFQVKKCRVDQG
jgi:hypothetical protein